MAVPFWGMVGLVWKMSSHRDIIAWQLGRESALAIYRHADAHWKPQRAAAFDQLRRAALSVVLNIAEGHASGRGARCRYHFRIAHGSAVETAEVLDFLHSLDGELAELLDGARRVAGITYRLWANYRG